MIILWKVGRVRFIALVLKTREGNTSVSSNLTLSFVPPTRLAHNT